MISVTVGVLCACTPANSGTAAKESSDAATEKSTANGETEAQTTAAITSAAQGEDTDIIKIYLVRHGKTFFNTTGQVQGWAD